MWEQILITIVAFLLSGIPLYLAVKLLGGKTGILKTAIVLFVSGLIVAAIKNYVDTLGALLAFIVMIWIYKESFKLGWFGAFFAWLLQFVMLAIIVIVFLLFGFSWFAAL